MTLTSWYKTDHKFVPSEDQYCALLEQAFNVKDPLGNPLPYNMTDYQREYHAQSINVKREEAQDLLVVKARGISFTFSSMIDYIMTGALFQGQLLPIIAQRYRSALDILNTCKWLIRNCNLKEIKDDCEISATEIRFKRTGSVIRAYPSASAADAIRGNRLIRAFLDEFAFQSKSTELLAAVQDCMQGSIGQIIIGSTQQGRKTLFFELSERPVGFYVYRLPVFDPHTFDVHKSIEEQPHLVPIAPWIDLKKLEVKRSRDVEIFRQEYMCDTLDDSLNFITYALVARVTDPDLKNLIFEMERNPDWQYETSNPIYIGVDVGRSQDVTAITAFEFMPDPNDDERGVFVQRYLRVIKNMSLPEQEDEITAVMRAFPSWIKCRIDLTGIGLGLFEHLRRRHGSKVDGVHFAAKVQTGEPHQKLPVIERMAVNLKNLMQDERVTLIEDDLQREHITNIDYNYRAKRNSFGHGDIFFACALCLLPLHHKQQQIAPLVTNVNAREYMAELHPEKQNPLPVLSVDTYAKAIEEAQRPQQWSSHLADMQKSRNKRIARGRATL